MQLSSYFRKTTDFQTFAAGEIIFEEGQAGDVMYFVLEGDVALLQGGHEVEVASAGKFFGELALIDHQPRCASAIAKTDCRLVPVDEQRFLLLVQQTPDLTNTVMRTMAERLHRRVLQPDD